MRTKGTLGRGAWRFLAALGGAVGLAAAWRRRRSRTDGDVGAHASLVSLDLARQEAKWTKNATNYKGGAKGG